MIDMFLNEILMPLALTVVSTAVSGGIAVVATQLRKRVGIDLELKRRQQLHDAIMTHTRTVLADLLLSGKLFDATHLDAEIKKRLRKVPDLLSASNPETVKVTKVKREQVLDFAEAKAAEILGPILAPMGATKGL